jgi:tetratricopeptide (TPR) repeat protein
LEDRQAAGGSIDFFLEGSIAVIADRLRVHAEIIDGEEELIVWSDNYETARTNYLAVQRDLSALIAEAISRELGIDAILPRSPAVNLDAYTAYLNGIFLSRLRGEEPLRASIEAFASALTMAPDFENARVALARAQALLPFYSQEEQMPAFAEVVRLLDALTQDSHAEAISIRGFIAYRQWRWQEAEAYFLDSLALDPNLANTHVWYSQFLAVVGRLEESLQHARMAYELDSVSPVVNDRLATAHLWNNQNDEAERLFSAGANLGFSSWQNPSYLVLLLRRQDYDALRLGLRALHPDTDLGPLPDNLEYLFVPEARTQLVDMLDTLIEQQQLSPRLEFGVWIILQQWDRVLATIEKYRDTDKKYLDFEFLFAQESESLRNDPLFEQITVTIGMQGYWQQSEGQPDFR